VTVVALAGCGAGKTAAPLPQTVIGTLPTKAPAKAATGGDPAAGKQLFVAQGCGACHTFKPAGTNGKIGPDLDKLAADAQKANQGTLAAYVTQSIADPNAYVVPGFQPGVMPKYSDTLKPKQIADLVAYLTQSSG
jgi:cytochrome c oxidase subunit 2